MSVEKLLRKAINEQQSGSWKSAEKKYKKILSSHPQHLDANYLLGTLKAEVGSYSEAEKLLKQALKIKPDSIYALNNLANVYKSRKRYDEAITLYRKILQINSNMPEANINIAGLLLSLNSIEEAMIHYTRALELNPELSEAKLGISSCYERFGELDKADKLLLELLETDSNNGNVLHMYTKNAIFNNNPIKSISQNITFIEHILNKYEKTWSKALKASIYLNLARLYEKNEDIDKSFQLYKKANEMQAYKFDKDAYKSFITLLTKENQSQHFEATEKSPIPIFIVGMPRTGSTLVESILFTSEETQTIGESNSFEQILINICKQNSPKHINSIKKLSNKNLEKIHNQYLKQWDGKSKYLINKNLFNYYYIDTIFKVFKNARIIHMTRNPLDTMLSCYGINFSDNRLNFSYNLEDLGWYYGQYSNLMAHWNSIYAEKLLTLSYEEIINQNEGTIKELFSFCDMPFNKDWKNFHASKREVYSASLRQVKQPLYTESVHRAKAFEQHMEPAINEYKAISNSNLS